MGRTAHLLKGVARNRGNSAGVPSAPTTVSTGTESVLFNALPLLLLAGVYFAVTVALAPALARERSRSHVREYVIVAVFPAIGAAAAILGLLVIVDRQPVGGHVWLSLVAILIAILPALLFLAPWGDRVLLVGGSRRVRDAEARMSLRDRELEAVAAMSNALARAHDVEEAARPLIQRVRELVGVEFSGVVVVDEAATTAVGVLADLDGDEPGWWRELRLDLRSEPSGIASAVFDAAPVSVYDAAGSTHISPRLAQLVGAKSGVWVPLIAEERVIGVLVAASTHERRAFTHEEIALLQALAGEEDAVALTVRRAEPLGTSEQILVDTLSREVALAVQTARLLAENQRRLEQQSALLSAAQVVTSELELDAVLQRLVQEVTKLLRADAADCYLLDESRGVLRCAAVYGVEAGLVGFEVKANERISELSHPSYEGIARTLVAPMVWAGKTRGVLGVGIRDGSRTFDEGDLELLEAFASLASLALRNAESFGERTHQARVQQAFYRIAELLGEPLSLAETLDAAAQAAVEALGGDFGAVVTPESGDLTVAGSYELPADVRELELPLALAEAAGDGRIVAAPRVAEDDRLDETWRNAPFASLLAIPIEGDSPGLVLVLFAEERSFDDDDLELARRLARAARGAFERSRLYEAERTARSLSQQLARTGSLLATELDPAAVLEEVVAQAAALLGVEAGALAQLEGDELVVSAAVGEGAEDALGARSPSTGWLGGDVVQSRAPVAYADVDADPALADADAVLSAGYRAYLGVPLTGREGALHGVLTVYDQEPRTWREEEIEALSALAANASVALSNAELYQRVAVEREQSVAILANVADGIVAVDRDGHVVVWNAAAEQITGVPTAEALGRTTAQVLQRNLESDDGVGANRLVSIMRGNEEVWLSLSEAVMRDPTGAVAGRIFAFRDISAERGVEQMKSEFVSAVSHQLRAPLTSIYGFAQTLLRQDIEFGDPERHTFLSYISSESERLTRIVDKLLNVARLDTGDLTVALEPTDVRPVLTDAVATVEAAAANGHRFVVDLDGADLRAQADPDKLRQVLDHLVDNAVKFSPDGGVVRVEARGRADAVEITVADEGVGIPPSQHERIFSKLYRGGGDDGSSAGTGLGLFIVHGLVQAMGGRIWVDSEEGRGARFTFELAAARGE